MTNHSTPAREGENQPCSDPIVETANYERDTLLLTLFAFCAGHPEIEVTWTKFGFRLEQVTGTHHFHQEIEISINGDAWSVGYHERGLGSTWWDLGTVEELLALLQRLKEAG